MKLNHYIYCVCICIYSGLSFAGQDDWLAELSGVVHVNPSSYDDDIYPLDNQLGEVSHDPVAHVDGTPEYRPASLQDLFPSFDLSQDDDKVGEVVVPAHTTVPEGVIAEVAAMEADDLSQEDEYSEDTVVDEDETEEEQRKSRLRWTAALHAKFLSALSTGANSPKPILLAMTRMNPRNPVVQDLTISNVKSHLQKWRLQQGRIHRSCKGTGVSQSAQQVRVRKQSIQNSLERELARLGVAGKEMSVLPRTRSKKI